ncbi:glycosyltransferase [Jeotgalibaca caeni]|uniref:glycosyltransferase n=1 Tax=Jeotgalibaca caeni TaxID=3028623 RepID=UPI00237E621D|nr:glycosyltransferase family 2 protein [Jeotgalibaca caeni]MDE1549561.1 glycosyltransferase family 2 protein [Jeotgalibaca caeni]
MTILFIVWIAIGWLAGWFAFARIPFLKQKTMSLQSVPSISIIIPARNEEKVLPKLLASIEKQTVRPKEVLVVDDDSEDGTQEIARQYGVSVLKNSQEAGGKASACWDGAEKATGEWLLFLDADTYFEAEDSLERLARKFEASGGTGIVSAQPYHETDHLHEQLSFVFNVVIMAGLNAFSILGDTLRTGGAFGPSIMCTKEEYVKVKGHQGMEAGILDDVALAKRFQEKGYPIELLGGKGTIAFQMFPEGFKQLVQGWSKDFATAARSTHPLILTSIVLWVSAGVGAGAAFQLLDQPFTSIVYALYLAQCIIFANRVGNFHFFVLFAYPILFLFFLVLFAWSFIQTYVIRSVTWKGRKVKL